VKESACEGEEQGETMIPRTSPGPMEMLFFSARFMSVVKTKGPCREEGGINYRRG